MRATCSWFLVLSSWGMNKVIVNKFETLNAWREAHKLVITVYKCTKNFPKDETYRLTDQLCRASSSVAANLVEGTSRNTNKEYRQFAFQARGSLEETKYHLLLAKDLGYLNEDIYNDIMFQADKTGKLINGLIRYLRTKIEDLSPKIQELRTKN